MSKNRNYQGPTISTNNSYRLEMIPQIVVGICIFLCLLWVILYASFGQMGTQILAIVLLSLLIVGFTIILIYIGHSMTKKTITETDRREFAQSSGAEAKIIASLVQMAGRSSQDAVRIAQLINSESNKAAQRARQESQPLPQLPLLGGNQFEITDDDDDEEDCPMPLVPNQMKLKF